MYYISCWDGPVGRALWTKLKQDLSHKRHKLLVQINHFSQYLLLFHGAAIALNPGCVEDLSVLSLEHTVSHHRLRCSRNKSWSFFMVPLCNSGRCLIIRLAFFASNLERSECKLQSMLSLLGLLSHQMSQQPAAQAPPVPARSWQADPWA